jgi:hypothetical protein
LNFRPLFNLKIKCEKLRNELQKNNKKNVKFYFILKIFLFTNKNGNKNKGNFVAIKWHNEGMKKGNGEKNNDGKGKVLGRGWRRQEAGGRRHEAGRRLSLVKETIYG